MKKEKLFMGILLGLTAAGMTVSAFLTGVLFSMPLRILPLYISLAVYLLNSRVNRYGLLLGAFNSLLYAAIYMLYKLYASVFFAVAVSFTFQFVTFLRWNKRPYGNSTVLKKMTLKKALLFAGAFVICWCGTVTVTTLLKSDHSLLDSTSSLIGLLVSILMLLSYYEYAYINVLSVLIGMALYISLIPQYPEQITYLVFSVYSLICCVIGMFKTTALYKEQQ